MAYTAQTFLQTKVQLAERLSDTGMVHWTDTELGIYVKEALRTFGLLSGFWRERGTVNTTSGTSFYDLTTLLSGSLLTYTVTDHDIIQEIQYMLLEDASDQTTWPGTNQFTYEDVTGAVQRRLNQFLSDTGIIQSRITQVATLTSRQQLPDTVIDVRRVANQGVTPLNYWNRLKREDEFSISAGNIGWTTEQGTPQVFSVMAPPPLTLTLSPTPSSVSTLELIVVKTGTPLTPDTTPSVIGIPDDVTPAIKWGALADLLGKDGPAYDPARADFCEKRYTQYVQLTRLLSCVVNVEIQGRSKIAETLHDLDEGFHDWQNYSGQPGYIALCGWNLAAIAPVPNNVYSLTFDVVRNSVVPTSDSDYLQVGREQFDMILDYAEHLALFKSGGEELNSSMRQADNFMTQSITYNQRLAAAASYVITPKDASQRTKYQFPRRESANSLGAQPSQTEARSFVKQRVPVRMN